MKINFAFELEQSTARAMKNLEGFSLASGRLLEAFEGATVSLWANQPMAEWLPRAADAVQPKNFIPFIKLADNRAARLAVNMNDAVGWAELQRTIEQYLSGFPVIGLDCETAIKAYVASTYELRQAELAIPKTAPRKKVPTVILYHPSWPTSHPKLERQARLLLRFATPNVQLTDDRFAYPGADSYWRKLGGITLDYLDTFRGQKFTPERWKMFFFQTASDGTWTHWQPEAIHQAIGYARLNDDNALIYLGSKGIPWIDMAKALVKAWKGGAS